MATILLKKRETTGAPAVGDLTNSSAGAEVAINLEDLRIYSKTSAGSIVELGTNPSEISLDGGVSEAVDIRAASGAAATVNVDWSNNGVVYLTAETTSNFNINIRGASGVPLNSVLATGEAAGFAVLITQGASAVTQTNLLVDSVTAAPYWQNGIVAPENGSGIVSFAGEVIKTGSATFSVLESLTQFTK